MKKWFLPILTAVMCFTLAACGSKDYDRRSFDDFFGNEFHWDMTIEEAATYINTHQILTAEIETTKHDTYTILTDDYYIFRFDSDGKMEFVKLKIGPDEQFLDYLTDEYGEHDKETKIGKSKPDFIYFWYGTMCGEPAEMSLHCSTLMDYYLLEFSPKE